MRQLWFKDINEQFLNKVTLLAHYNNNVVNPAKKKKSRELKKIIKKNKKTAVFHMDMADNGPNFNQK